MVPGVIAGLLAAARRAWRTAGATAGSRPSAGRPRASLALGAAVVSVMVLLTSNAAPASAHEGHVLSGSFGAASSSPANPYPLGMPSGVAVDLSSDASHGDIYVTDLANGWVEKFNSSGDLLLIFGGDVNHTHPGDVCTIASGDTCQAGTLGSEPGEFAIPAFVAVDDSSGPSQGDVYVADAGTNLVQKFTPNGTLITSWGTGGQLNGETATDGPFGGLAGVAVDSSGELGVFDTSSRMYEFAQDGTFVKDFTAERGTNPSGLGFNPTEAFATGALYKANEEGSIEKFSGAGDIGQLTASGGATGLAVDPASSDLYVDNSGVQIDRYSFESSGDVIESGGPSCAPAPYVGCNPSESFGAGQLSGAAGLAAGTTAGTVLAAEAGNARVERFVEAILADITTGAASSIHATSATVSGHVDPAGGGEVIACQFEYGTETSYGQSAPCSPAAPLASATNVSANLAGLTAGVTYHYRLQASNASGASVGQDGTFTTEAPSVENVIASAVSSEDATLRAQINNHGADATYRFEYGTADCATSACTAAPVPAGDASASGEPVAVAQTLHYLQPDVTYHYRLIASNSVGERASSDQTFHTFATGSGFQLPDGRAWELVSPVEKNGGGVASVVTRTRAAAEGNAVAYVSLAGFGDVAGMGANGEYESVRDATPGTQGWSTHSIMPKLAPVSANAVFTAGLSLYTGEFSSDLNAGVLTTFTNLSGDPNLEDVTNLYLRRDLNTPGAGTYQTLTACSICTAPLRLFQAPRLVGASANYEHVVFEAWAQLTADAPSEPSSCVQENSQCAPLLYEWDQGVVRYVGNLPAAEGGRPAASSIGARQSDNATVLPNGSISEDGSRVLFTVPQENSLAGPLYMRIDHSTTVRVSAGELTEAPDPHANAFFQAANPDLSKVVFISDRQLTDTPVGVRPLYLYDATQPEGHHLTLIAGETEGVVGASSDVSYVYFLSSERLLPNQPEFPSAAPDGIYLWHNGAISLVGSIPGFDSAEVDVVGRVADAYGARVTPSGKYLLFTSHSGEGLTGYNQSIEQPGCEGTCSELYLYSAEDHSLKCASCNPTGVPPTANASFLLGTRQGGTAQSTHLNNPLSDDGRYVFFTSGERLVPEDHNSPVADVYEYDSQTEQIHLLSSGRSDQPSFFLDASADGHDVFFTTFERLVGWDTDDANDLYDARVGGGFPAPTRPVECEGDACSTPFAAPNDPTPSSSTFSGPGSQEAPSSQQSKLKAKQSLKRKVKHKAKKRKARRGSHRKAKTKRAKHSAAGRTHR
jgi:hypothetical protein